MANFKIGRLSEDIKREFSALLRDVKDPRVSKMLSVIRCEVSGDCSHCKIYVSAFEGAEVTKESVKGLQSATGFLRREIGNRLHLRKCPELHFVVDGSIEYSAKINHMLKDLAPAGEEPEETEEA